MRTDTIFMSTILVVTFCILVVSIKEGQDLGYSQGYSKGLDKCDEQRLQKMVMHIVRLIIQ